MRRPTQHTSVHGPELPETVTDAVVLLEREGFSASLTLSDAGVQCDACGADHRDSELRIRRRYRFEGPTDPADESIVLGIEHPLCGARGILVSAYGPQAERQLLALLDHLPER
jgi:hypothetical protein